MLKNFFTFILQWVAITFISTILLVLFRPGSTDTQTALFMLSIFSPPFVIYWYRWNLKKAERDRQQEQINKLQFEKINGLIDNISISQEPFAAYCNEYEKLTKQEGELSFTEIQREKIHDAIVSRYCELRRPPSTHWQKLIKEGSAFVFKADEKALYQTECSSYDSIRRERHYEAGNRGMSVRLMKGVSVRVGNTAGRSVSTDIPVNHSASQIVLTTKSLYYFENEAPKRILFKNIIGADIINNGYSIKVVQDGVRSKPVCFNFESTAPASLIRQIIDTDW